MTIETQEIEYKDFSKNPSPDKKDIISKLFIEISAFANASGGRIVVGKENKTGKLNAQPKEIIEWLENDKLTSEINRHSDNLVIFSCEEKDGLIIISIQESEDVISASVDFKNVNKGDSFVRENHEAVLAKGNKLKTLLERKSISTDSRLNYLRKIVHYKFSIGKNSASHMNIFDSLVITVNSEEKHISTMFDALVQNQFIGSYYLPLSKHSTMQMHLNTFFSILKSPGNSVAAKRDAFRDLLKNSHFIDSFFKSHKDNVLRSQELKNYIFEFRNLIDKLYKKGE